MTPPAAIGLAPRVIAWQRTAGRHDLPWQQPAPGRAPLRDPYRVWLSEVMLQQTQVVTAMPYFEAFLAAFPTVQDLAAAPADRVMARWSGLGYYSRARNLHAAARQVVAHHGGRFPADAASLETLPGVGRSTAAAIAVFAFGERAAILDGNVKRVFSRVFAVDGDPAASPTIARLWQHAEAELPAAPASADALIAYTQGLMDLGATCCSRRQPACGRCPLAEVCIARREQAVDRFPAARRRRALPLRTADLLFVRAADRVLVETRPPSGIWGSLQSLPEMAPMAEVAAGTGIGTGTSTGTGTGTGTGIGTEDRPVAAAIAERLERWGLEVREAPWPMARIDHVFTHFRLQARVWCADVAAGGEPAAPMAWLDLAAVDDAPLPGPIRQLLRDLRQPMAAPAVRAAARDGRGVTDTLDGTRSADPERH